MFLLAKCLKCTQKSCFWGLGWENLIPKYWDPLGNQSPAKHAIWCKNDGDMSLRLFSRAWQVITKKIKIKNYTINFWTLYFTNLPGGPCWADCSIFLHVGWHPRRNHSYQILSRSLRGLRSYGGPKSGFSHSFPTALTTVFRTTVLHCDVLLN